MSHQTNGVQVEAETKDEGAVVKLPGLTLASLKNNLPWLLLVLLGGDRIASEYIAAPQNIRDIQSKVTDIDKRLDNIERALGGLTPATRPAFK